MKKAIIGLSTNPPQRASSHAAGWVNKWKELCEADVLTTWDTEQLNEYDTVAIFNDINGKPGLLNMFGFKPDNEVGEKLQKRIDMLEASKCKVVQLDYEQTWHTCLTQRKLRSNQWMDEVPYMVMTNKKNIDGIVVGDSHSVSVAPTGFAVNRNDGQTLHGALKKGLSSFISRTDKAVVWKFGDIDLRHHIMRHGNEGTLKANIICMIQEYKKQADQVDPNSFVVAPMPQVEDDRKIPKSGFYKGTAFFGSLENRQRATELFTWALGEEFGDRMIDPYENHVNEKGYLDQSLMEAGGSFHLAPHSYPTEFMDTWLEQKNRS